MNPTNKIIKDLEGKKIIRVFDFVCLKCGDIGLSKKQVETELYRRFDLEQSLNNYFKNLEKEIDYMIKNKGMQIRHSIGSEKGYQEGIKEGLQKAKEIMFRDKK